MMRTVTMWAVITPDGEIMQHTLDQTRDLALLTFRLSAHPKRPMSHWEAKGYRVVELTISYDVKPLDIPADHVESAP